MSSNFIFILMILVTCVSCNPIKQTIPENVATKLEENQIDLALQEIEQITADLGVPRKFRNLPIYVVSEDPITANRVGFCSALGFGEKGYIAINRSVFDQSSNNGRLNLLFGVLLHEIGHCYFHRDHENSVIEKSGFRFDVEATDSVGGTYLYFDALAISIMYSHENSASDLIRVPSSFKRYFVSELLGLSRLKTIEDLEKIPGVRVVPRSE